MKNKRMQNLVYLGMFTCYLVVVVCTIIYVSSYLNVSL